MRKKTGVVLIAAGMLLAAALPARGNVDESAWQYAKKIVLPAGGSAAFIAVPLDHDVYECSTGDLRDLRVVAGAGREVPYALVSQEDVVREKNVFPTIIDRQITQEACSLTVQVAAGREFNCVRVIPARNGFVRRIIIEGSDDQQSWEIIRKGTRIYSIDRVWNERSVEHYQGRDYYAVGYGRYQRKYLTVTFPPVRYRYVRIQTFHDLDKEPIPVERIELTLQTKTAALESACTGVILGSEVADNGKDVNVTVDFGARQLPLRRVVFTAKQDTFSREVDIYESNDLKDWVKVGSGALLRNGVEEGSDESLEIPLSQAACRYLKVTVHNNDNTPITFTAVTGYLLEHYIVFRPEEGLSYRLLYGNPLAHKAVYDISSLIRDKTVDELAHGALGVQTVNPEFNPQKERKPWTDERPILLWGAMLAVMAGIVFLGIRVISTADQTQRKGE